MWNNTEVDVKYLKFFNKIYQYYEPTKYIKKKLFLIPQRTCFMHILHPTKDASLTKLQIISPLSTILSESSTIVVGEVAETLKELSYKYMCKTANESKLLSA